MSMHGIAPRTTHVEASSTDQKIVSGETIIVYGIKVEGTSVGTVIIEESGTTTVKLRISILANTTASCDIPFYADKGIQVTTPANVTCTVFHSQAGA